MSKKGMHLASQMDNLATSTKKVINNLIGQNQLNFMPQEVQPINIQNMVELFKKEKEETKGPFRIIRNENKRTF